ncbi:hypothetical protein N825_08350 [Skermanella stibiiresistens SB22]|uniref:Phasin domain-containing protein n=1 Tax=Skermanella stibiiresistens SB22 TaxID=1385369 RepID=W9H2R5_9PROT|nr:phasin family protein [Skermanella stibiiresistens]EWY39002.1 hypothetical protein N825_08350 [Skermanella stibiiresistens SB22]
MTAARNHGAARIGGKVGTPDLTADRMRRIFDASTDQSLFTVARATRNLDMLIQCGNAMAEGWRAILEEWSSTTLEVTRRNMSDAGRLAECRSLDALLSCQSDIVRDRIEIAQESQARISEVSSRMANGSLAWINDLSSAVTADMEALSNAGDNLRETEAAAVRVGQALAG